VVAKKHDFTSTEIKAGLMVIASIVVAVVLVLAALDRPDLIRGAWTAVFGQHPVHRYAVKFEEASGLNKNADVRFGGAKAGKVVNVELDKKERRIVAVLEVDASIPVNTASRAYIGQATLTSEPHVEVTVGTPDAPLLVAAAKGEGGTKPEEFEGMPVIPSGAGGLFGSMTKLANDLRDLIGVEKAKKAETPMTTVADVVDSVNNTLTDGQDLLHQTSDILDERNEDVGQILDQQIHPILEDAKSTMASAKSFAGTMQNSGETVNKWIKDNDPRLTATVESAQQIAGNIQRLTGELENYQKKVSTILDNGEVVSGDAKAMLQRNAPVIEDMLSDLRDAMRFFVNFAEILAENPQALLRGQREGGREPDEKGTLGREPDRR